MLFFFRHKICITHISYRSIKCTHEIFFIRKNEEKKEKFPDELKIIKSLICPHFPFKQIKNISSTLNTIIFLYKKVVIWEKLFLFLSKKTTPSNINNK